MFTGQTTSRNRFAVYPQVTVIHRRTLMVLMIWTVMRCDFNSQLCSPGALYWKQSHAAFFFRLTFVWLQLTMVDEKVT